MDKVKVSADRRIEPNLQKLARALISIARRQLNDDKAVPDSAATPAPVSDASKDAA